MIFTDTQIQEILSIVEYQSAFLVAANIGTDALSKDEIEVLRKFDTSVSDLYQKFPPAVKSFFFGRLSALIGDYNAQQLTYSDFLQYLNKAQYIPLSTQDKAELSLIKQMSTSHIKSFGDKIKSNVNNIILEESSNQREQYSKVLKREMSRATVDKKSLTNIVSEIGKQTGNWEKDWGRIVDTEMNNIYQQGRAQTISNIFTPEAKVYKMPYPDACRHCIRLYLTSGVGSKPQTFTLQEMISFGTNVGRKVADWKPVLGSMHPHCRCHLVHVLDGQVWDEDNQRFEFPKKVENKIPRKSKIKVQVGSKVFNV